MNLGRIIVFLFYALLMVNDDFRIILNWLKITISVQYFFSFEYQLISWTIYHHLVILLDKNAFWHVFHTFIVSSFFLLVRCRYKHAQLAWLSTQPFWQLDDDSQYMLSVESFLNPVAMHGHRPSTLVRVYVKCLIFFLF